MIAKQSYITLARIVLLTTALLLTGVTQAQTDKS